jgi:hypothetical protein
MDVKDDEIGRLGDLTKGASPLDDVATGRIQHVESPAGVVRGTSKFSWNRLSALPGQSDRMIAIAVDLDPPPAQPCVTTDGLGESNHVEDPWRSIAH